MSENKIKVAVIGCGSIAEHRHIAEYGEHPDVQLVAFSDPVVERANKFAEKYQGRAYIDYREMLATEEIDAVSVCTPNVVHGPATIAAAQAGYHVLCEKPMAISCEESSEMIRIAKENKIKLMVGHNQRLMSPHVKAKELLQSGELGKVLTFRSAFSHGGPESWAKDGADSWFFRKEQAFVGALGDLGVHKIDLVMWLLEADVVEVSSMMERLEKAGDVDDNALILARMSTGAIGTFTASWTHAPGEDNSTIFYCEHGILKLGVDAAHPVIVEQRNGEVKKYQVGGIATNEEGGQIKSGIVDAFVDAIQKDEEPVIPGEEGRKALEVVLAAIQSVEEKRNIMI